MGVLKIFETVTRGVSASIQVASRSDGFRRWGAHTHEIIKAVKSWGPNDTDRITEFNLKGGIFQPKDLPQIISALEELRDHLEREQNEC